MKTVVYQSFRTINVPTSIKRCLETVREWAKGIGADYRFFGDEIFDMVPSWYLAKTQKSPTLVTDLARLSLARDFLSQDYERAIWVDADCLIFAPDNFVMPARQAYNFCREFWIYPADGQIRVERRVHNAVSIFQNETSFLDHYIETCQQIVKESSGPFKGDEVGTRYLSALQPIINFPVMSHIGLFSPALMNDIAENRQFLAPQYMARMGQVLSAGNLCGSFSRKQADGVSINEPLFHRVIDRLLENKGEILNQWCRPDALIKLAGQYCRNKREAVAISLLEAAATHQTKPSDYHCFLAHIHLDQKNVQKAYDHLIQALRADPFHERAYHLNHQLVSQAVQNDVKSTFCAIYANKDWGQVDEAAFFSGPGSLRKNALKYCNYVSRFIHENNIRSIIDLGCGDYTVSAQIDTHGADYIGLDLVGDLIKHNTKTFGSDHVRFQQANIIQDDSPDGDLCLVRQVLQHLSFADIEHILEKVKKYRYVLITDGQAPLASQQRRNIDKVSDKHTRATLFHNGLWLELAPFNLKGKVVCEQVIEDGFPAGETLRTLLLENTP